MSIFFLILGIATADTNPAMLLIKIPITNKAKEITCDMAFENTPSVAPETEKSL